jgi:glyoxylase-like metal-dependent hydrolase (beta-lactamase superfamily II)
VAKTRAPERVAPGVYRADAVGFPNAVSVLLLENDDGWTLVDTGLGSSVGRIRDALAALGAEPRDLKRIFLTHHHTDHTGGLPGLLEWSPEAELGTTEHEAEIVSGSRRLDERPNRIVRSLDRRLQLSTPPVGKVLREGDLVSGFRVILTPGHTSGHASLLRDEDGLLFTGDAFGAVALRRIRVGVVKIFCTDPPLAKRSAEKLLQEEFDTVVMSHGKPLYAGARQELREAVARCNYG